MKHTLLQILLCFTLTMGVSHEAFGQITNSDIMSALDEGESDRALTLATSLYDSSVKTKNSAQAGYAAYAMAQIYDLQKLPKEAAEAYKDCADQYKKAGSAAQSLQCRYQSGLGFYAAGKKATAADVLKAGAKELETIGQDKSELAANLYLVLARATLPLKTSSKQSARDNRNATIAYADRALVALEHIGKKQTHLYASALYLKGLALEDNEAFEKAAAIYKEALEMSKTNTSTPKDFEAKVSTRYSIARSNSSNRKKITTIMGEDIQGNRVALTIKRKRKIKVPRLKNNTMVDGAAVRSTITLNNDGSVKNIDILESRPSVKYGEAFEKAVRTWKFIPPENVSGSDVLPFDYNMTFSIQRR